MKTFALLAGLSILTGAWLGALQPTDQVPADAFAPTQQQVAQSQPMLPKARPISRTVLVKATGQLPARIAQPS